MEAPRNPEVRKAFLAGAVVAVAITVLCSEPILVAAFGQHALADGASSLASRGRLLSGCLAALLFTLAYFAPSLGTRFSVFLVSGTLLVVGFEALGGPFVGRDTTLFQRDPHLGWRLRAGGDDEWLGTRIKINSRGMRGEEPRGGDGQRLLLLGDSVVFGAFLEFDSDTIPAQMTAGFKGAMLDVQCLNGGVGGWAPWQELRWYEEEGARLGAEVVLLNLVLNDVTEPLSLSVFGGTEEGFQLNRTRDPGALAGTTWATAIRRWRRAARDDNSRTAAAQAEALGVYELLRSPSLPASRSAWARHLDEVSSLVEAIRAEGATPVIVLHPYTVQFEVAGFWWPQEALAAWCKSQGVRCFDVGGYLAQELSDPLGAYFDAVHPNKKGASMIAAGLVAFLRGSGLVK